MTTSFKFERPENTRQSIYTCIRYASKFIKLRPDLRKSHPATLHEKLPVATLDDDETTLYDDKDEKRMTWLRNESQLIYPSRFPGTHLVPEITKEEVEDEEEVDSSDFDPEDYIDDSDTDDVTEKDEAYFKAWKKLSGYTLQSDEPKTAVLITLSPNALAAANVAKLRRKRVHTH
ncbi:hypothetical protein K501DRAFT_285586 [Backusella circina FSU 941]|nr:hypothetical protein K501DRAFT_285586 [Backusella circina FSU 941]